MFYPELLKNYLRPYTQFPERALYSNSGNPYLFADLKKKKKTLNNLAVFPVKRPGLSGHHDLRPTPRPSHTDIPPPPSQRGRQTTLSVSHCFPFPGFLPDVGPRYAAPPADPETPRGLPGPGGGGGSASCLPAPPAARTAEGRREPAGPHREGTGRNHVPGCA